jgi:hypothetical protein
MVLKLRKALYELKQAPRAWNVKLNGSLMKLGLKKCVTEPAIYTRGEGLSKLVLGVYVDDLIVSGGDPKATDVFKKQMTSEFEMSDLVRLSYYLGIEVEQKEDHITMDPGTKLDANKQGERADATRYRRIIICLRYLLHTRPDLSFSVGLVSRFMKKLTAKHYNAVKRIIRYVKGTVNYRSS